MRLVGSPPTPGPGSLAGLLAGVALGTMSITLVFLGMRAVMAIGGACADGGPYVPARPCPEGVPLAMVGGTFGLFGAAGLLIWFGSRFGPRWAMLPLLGWPALFVGLGWNFLEFGVNPPGGGGWEWGWLICGVIFVLMGGAPLFVAILAIRAGRSARETVRTLGRRGPGKPGDPAVSPAGGPHSFPPVTFATRGHGPESEPGDLVARLERLAELHHRGELTDAEFAAAKASLLDEAVP